MTASVRLIIIIVPLARVSHMNEYDWLVKLLPTRLQRSSYDTTLARMRIDCAWQPPVSCHWSRRRGSENAVSAWSAREHHISHRRAPSTIVAIYLLTYLFNLLVIVSRAPFTNVWIYLLVRWVSATQQTSYMRRCNAVSVHITDGSYRGGRDYSSEGRR